MTAIIDRTRALLATLVLALVLGACSSGSGDAVASGTSLAGISTSSSTVGSSTISSSSTSSSSATSGSSSSTAPTGTTSTTASGSTTTAASGSACTTGSAAIPAGAVSRQVIDVDGDNKPDTAWLSMDSSGAVTAGIATAAGGGTQRIWNSASPVTRSLLVLDINGATPPVILADDGRTVQLWDFVDCTIADVDNPQGDPYTFSLGFTDYGTGIGCASVAGQNQLVGLNATSSADGNTVDWSSTVVTISGTKASNGAVSSGSYTSPADDAQIDLLHEVTCGSATIAGDGLTLPQ